MALLVMLGTGAPLGLKYWAQLPPSTALLSLTLLQARKLLLLWLLRTIPHRLWTLMAYIVSQATGTAGTGTPLTSDGAGGIVEFEAAFINFYNKYRLSPTVIYLSAQELVNITKKIVANGGAPLLRLTTDAANPSSLQAGVVIGQYLNKVMNVQVAVRVHPNMPAGTVLFYTEKLPYALSNVGEVARMLMRQDYYQLEWPLKTRKYEYGVYADGVLQHYAPFSMGVINNIANG